MDSRKQKQKIMEIPFKLDTRFYINQKWHNLGACLQLVPIHNFRQQGAEIPKDSTTSETVPKNKNKVLSNTEI